MPEHREQKDHMYTIIFLAVKEYLGASGLLEVWTALVLRRPSGLEGRKSRSGERKIEVWRVANGGLEGGASSRLSWRRPETVLEASWGRLEPPEGRLGVVLGGPETVLWAVLGTSWRNLSPSQAILGRLGRILEESEAIPRRLGEVFHVAGRLLNDFE